jgi:hypothetical protein
MPTAPSVLFERIVAVVDKDVISEGELLAEAKLALVMQEGSRAASLVPDGSLRVAFLEHLIDQMLVARESRRMGAAQVPNEDIDARMVQLAAKFPSQDSYLSFTDTLTMDPAFVRTVMARDLTNERYIHHRLDTRLAAQGRNTPGANQDEAFTQALRIWLKELRQGVAIRVLDEQGLLRTQRVRR